MSGSLTECADTDRQSWNAAFRALGLRWDWSWDTYAELRRHGSERDLAQRFSQFIGEEVDTDKINDMYERCFQARFSGDVGLRQGVAELLKWTVRQSFGLAFVSRYGPGVVRPLLAATARARGGIEFDAVVTGSADIRQTPHPDAIELAMSELGVDEAMVIADTPAGAAAGLDAGQRTIAFPGFFQKIGRFPKG